MVLIKLKLGSYVVIYQKYIPGVLQSPQCALNIVK